MTIRAVVYTGRNPNHSWPLPIDKQGSPRSYDETLFPHFARGACRLGCDAVKISGGEILQVEVERNFVKKTTDFSAGLGNAHPCLASVWAATAWATTAKAGPRRAA